MDRTTLTERFDALETSYNGTFSVAAVDLADGQRFERRHDEVRETASTCKLFILCELFRQAEAGLINLDDAVDWEDGDRRGGDGVLRAMTAGQPLTIRNMAVLMMIISDNIATARIARLVGTGRVTQTMGEWGLTNTRLYDGLPGGEDVHTMKQPVSTTAELCCLMLRIHRREILSPPACDEIVRILRAQRCNDMLGRYLPVGEDWGDADQWIANKTGYGRCRVEVGIVKAEAASFVMAMSFRPHDPPPLLTKCLADYPPVLAMAHGCRAVWDAVCR